MGSWKELRPSIAAFLLMMAMSLTTTALSFFIGPVCQELSLGRGSFTVYYSLMTASGALAAPVLGQVINKKGVRGIVAVSGVWVPVCLLGFSMSGSLWMFYVAASCLGFFGTACVSLCATVIVQQAYSSERASALMGLVMSGSGVGGMVVSALLPGFLDRLGWRMGYRLLALLWLLLCLGAWMLLGKGAMVGGVGHRRTPLDGMTRAEALKSPKLYLLIFAIFLLAAGCGVQQQLPSLLAGYGFETGQVSAMVGFFTAALAVGKILQGLLYGRMGAVRGGYVVVAIFAGSFLLLRNHTLAYPALAALAVGMGSVTTLMPVMTRFAFGPKEYAAIWSILSTASNAGTLIAAPVWGMAYDATNSYELAILGSAGLVFLALGALFVCFRKTK